MNITQMKYFIVTAKCLNFTKAADKLFISQPALSKQITAMERELNMQLFIRSNRSVKLTPPAKILLEEFEKIYTLYNQAIQMAANSFKGLSGELNIGILEGTYVGDLFPRILTYFEQNYPNIKINLRNYSFNLLVEKLYSNELDFIITLFFDVEYREKIQYRIIEKTRDHVVVHKNHPLAKKKKVSLADFAEDTFIMVSPEDSETSPRLIIDSIHKAGVQSPKIKYASTLQEEVLWVESGVGVCILDSRSNMSHNSSVRFLEVDPISDPSLTLAWNEDNYNPMKKIFLEKWENINE